MTGGFFTEVVKVLIHDADKAFSSGVLGRAVQNLTKGATSAPGIAGAARAALQTPATQVGQNVYQPVPPAANPVPILKQILSVLTAIGVKVGLIPGPAPGGPQPPPLKQQLQDLLQSIAKPASAFVQGQQNQPGLAKFKFRQMAQQLSGKPFFKTWQPQAAAGGAATPGAGIGGMLLKLGRFAGVVGLVTTLLGGAAAALRAFVAGILDENRELAKYNARLATSVLKLDMVRMRMDLKQANDVSGTGAFLNDEFGKLLQEVQPIRSMIGQALNYLAIGAVAGARGVVLLATIKNIGNRLLPGLGDILDFLIKSDDKEKDKGGLDSPLNQDLRAFTKFDPLNRAPLPDVKPPAFIPPLVRPFDRLNKGGIVPP